MDLIVIGWETVLYKDSRHSTAGGFTEFAMVGFVGLFSIATTLIHRSHFTDRRSVKAVRSSMRFIASVRKHRLSAFGQQYEHHKKQADKSSEKHVAKDKR